MQSGYFPSNSSMGNAPRPAVSMNPMMGNTMGGNMPRPMGSAGGVPRPMGMNTQQAPYNNRGPAGNMGGGYDPFSSLGGMQQRK